MFFFKSVRITGQRFIICFLCLLLILFFAFDFTGGFNTTAAADLEQDAAARENYIESMGWEIDPQSVTEKDIVIPSEFNEVYKNYNELQIRQGFDLENYCGQKAKLYTYEVTNYPKVPQNVVINLIVFEGKVIGGDVCSLELDGFMTVMK